MTDKPQPQDRQTCPQCHQPNDCAMSLGRAIKDCWCHSARFGNAALALIAEQQTRNHCICRICAQMEEEVADAR